jgi:hypothetical protein
VPPASWPSSRRHYARSLRTDSSTHGRRITQILCSDYASAIRGHYRVRVELKQGSSRTDSSTHGRQITQNLYTTPSQTVCSDYASGGRRDYGVRVGSEPRSSRIELLHRAFVCRTKSSGVRLISVWHPRVALCMPHQVMMCAISKCVAIPGVRLMTDMHLFDETHAVALQLLAARVSLEARAKPGENTPWKKSDLKILDSGDLASAISSFAALAELLYAAPRHSGASPQGPRRRYL